MDSANVAVEPVPPRRGRSGRRWRWFLALLLLAIVGAAAYAVAPLVRLKISEPYRMAFEEARKSPQVVQRLGQPIGDPTWLPAGSVYSAGPRGDAMLSFDVAGPNGRAHVSAHARKIAGQWGLTILEVTFSDGTRVALDTLGSAGSEAPRFGAGGPSSGTDAPKWQPGTEAPKWPPSTEAPKWPPSAEAPKWPPAGQPSTTGTQQAAPSWTPPMIPSMDKK